MELASNMEKKNQRAQGQLVKSGQEPNGKNVAESISKKNGNQYPRKREVENGRSAPPKRGGRQSQRYVRPREKVGGQVENLKQCSEFGSLQHAGGKKQNIAHLLNWWGDSPSDRHGHRKKSNGPPYNKARRSYPQRYNKDHFVQANCQFVVQAGEDYSASMKEPDHLVNWDLVEEVRLHVSEDRLCPICLHSPSAAKITRCGHVYCFPCILHYLALSDDKWRKCPICYEPVGKEDLKSVVVKYYSDIHPGEIVEMQLMRRERDSLIPCPVLCYDQAVKIYDVVSLNHPSHVSEYAKCVTATKEEVIKHILCREQRELENQLVTDGDEPEACFIEEALTLVSSKLSFLSDNDSVIMSHTASAVMKHSPSEDSLVGNCNALNFDSHFDKLSLNSDISPEEIVRTVKVSESSESVESLEYSLGQSCLSEESGGLNVGTRGSNHNTDQNVPKSTYYFYQAVNGSHIYLHSINTRMLIKQFGSLEMCPSKISGRVIEKQGENMTTELRSRLRSLGHITVTCSFDLVEIEMPPGLLSKDVLDEFHAHLEAREKNRRKRLKNEARVEKRFQKEEDKMMGRSRGANVHLSSYKHFPNFVEEEPNASLGNYPALGATAVIESSLSDSEWSTSSFAGAISKTKPVQTSQGSWPTLGGGGWPSSPPGVGHLLSTRAEPCTSVCDSDEEGIERAPNFNASFSDAFAKALDSAKKETGDLDGKRGGKKSKKKKGIVLLSSGGFH